MGAYVTIFVLNTSANIEKNTLFQDVFIFFLTLFQGEKRLKMTFFQDLQAKEIACLLGSQAL